MFPAPRIRSKVDAQGRILIPAEQRRALGLEPGDPVSLQVVDGELRVMTIDEEIRKAQELVRRYVPADRMLSEELIAERRTEARREHAR
ncbi:MAG: AbrB/MazE/SpoVT family DNA-binding domain-containing protein [Dehalococcoidia bacterium]|nr:AbrB/MazE/SpoVT family DNA-binding domain-containing protein [Dehalococcoidia bacterium]